MQFFAKVALTGVNAAFIRDNFHLRIKGAV